MARVLITKQGEAPWIMEIFRAHEVTLKLSKRVSKTEEEVEKGMRPANIPKVETHLCLILSLPMVST